MVSQSQFRIQQLPICNPSNSYSEKLRILRHVLGALRLFYFSDISFSTNLKFQNFNFVSIFFQYKSKMSGSNRTSPVPTAPSPGATSTKSQKCTAGRVRSIIKEIFAQLFSQVGLCLLVVGYSVMGATVFMSLEQPNELLTRIKVGSTRNQTLDDLYNLTGKCTPSLKKKAKILFRRMYVI